MSKTELTTDQLIALCDEMRALVRSGVPLERGLVTLSRDLPGRLGVVVGEMGERGEAGESIEQILSSDRIALPKVFRAVVLAGLRSGRLSVALEGMASTVRRVTEVRRSIVQASVYPLFVLCLVSVLAMALLGPLAESLQSVRDAQALPLESRVPWIIACVHWLGQVMWVAAPIVLVLFIVWCFRTRRASSLQPRTTMAWMSWLPWTRRLLRHGCLSTFTEILALLIQHDVPLQDGLPLAAEASGDGGLYQEAVEMSNQLKSGEPIDTSLRGSGALPPLIRWQLLAQRTPERLVESLNLISKSESRRADHLADWLRVQLPVILTIGIGGAATLVYALAVLAPWYSMLSEIGDPLLTNR